MERQNNRTGDHAAYCAAAVVILSLLTYCASSSAFVLHRFDLPVNCLQTKIFSRFFLSKDYDIEHRKIRKILYIVDTEVMKRGGYATINTTALKSAILGASKRTRSTTRMIAYALFALNGSFMIYAALRARRRIYGSNMKIEKPAAQGVEGFIRTVGEYLTPEIYERVIAAPTPECLGEAFSTARERVNIPCSIVARMFPKNSRERLTLLAYGKNNVRFAQLHE